MQISVKSDIDRLAKDIGILFRNQIPFVSQVAINATAFDVQRDTKKALRSTLHKPTAYTLRGVQVEKAKNKKAPVAKVGCRSNTFGKGQGKMKQAEYMERQIKGGARTPQKRTIIVPLRGRGATNAAGNIPESKLNRFLGDKNKFFVGKPRGAKGPGTGEGIWERRGKEGRGKIKMKISFNDVTRYSPRFPFKRIANVSVRKNFSRNFKNGFAKAIRSLAKR